MQSRSVRATVPLGAVRALTFTTLLLVNIAAPAAATAHAELIASDPADGATVGGPFAGPIVLTYSEALQPGSHAELLNAAGTRTADGVIDATDTTRMTLTPATALETGKYTVQWTSIAADKDVDRGTVTFTVSAATPPPAPIASATATAPSASASLGALTPGPSTPPGPSPSGAGSVAPATSGSDVLVPIVAALVLLAVLGGWLLRRSRSGR